MKLLQKKPEKSSKPDKSKKPKAGLSSELPFNAIKDELMESDPVRLAKLGIVAPTALRPRISRAVQAAGLNYRSISVSPTESVYFLVE